MKTKVAHCWKCNKRIPSQNFNLKAKQDGYIIRLVEVNCSNGHPNVIEVREIPKRELKIFKKIRNLD